MSSPEEVLAFWLDEVTPDSWYRQDDALDATIRRRFADAWDGAMQGRHGLWLTYPSGSLAYIVLTDQFSRNMFRGTGLAFASDPLARAAAKQAIFRGWDLKIDAPARQFFYLPLMHSENLGDQDRCVRLMKERMPSDGEGHPLHARAHREVIRQFGRFPTRNADLGRSMTKAEQVYMDSGGYGGIVQRLQQTSDA